MRPSGRDAKYIKKCHSIAQASIETIKMFETLDLSKVPDGQYRGSAMGYRANVDIEVEVKGGRIEAVKIVKHREDWFFTSFTDIPARIIERQGLKGVDAVSGATFTSTAIVGATGRALAGAMR